MLQLDIRDDVVSEVGALFLSEEVAWYLAKETCNPNGGCLDLATTKDVPQFCHFLFLDGQVLSAYFETAKKVLVDLERQLDKPFISRLQRAKANLICQDRTYQSGQHHMPHVDSFEDGSDSFIYYINTTDASTKFFIPSGDVTRKQECVAGRGLLFDSTIYHAGASPTDTPYRAVLNFVFSPRSRT